MSAMLSTLLLIVAIPLIIVLSLIVVLIALDHRRPATIAKIIPFPIRLPFPVLQPHPLPRSKRPRLYVLPQVVSPDLDESASPPPASA